MKDPPHSNKFMTCSFSFPQQQVNDMFILLPTATSHDMFIFLPQQQVHDMLILLPQHRTSSRRLDFTYNSSNVQNSMSESSEEEEVMDSPLFYCLQSALLVTNFTKCSLETSFCFVLFFFMEKREAIRTALYLYVMIVLLHLPYRSI